MKKTVKKKAGRVAKTNPARRKKVTPLPSPRKRRDKKCKVTPPSIPPAKAAGKKKANPLDIAAARGWRPPDKPGPEKKRKVTPIPQPLSPRRGERGAAQAPLDFRAKFNPTRQKFYESARILYVEEGYSLLAIQKKFKLSWNTVSRWRDEGQWESQRQVRQQGPQALVVDLEIALKKLVDDLSTYVRAGNRPWKGAADEINKLVNVIERLRGDAYFNGHLTKTVELMAEYLRVSDKNDLLKIIAEVLPGFTVWALSGRKT